MAENRIRVNFSAAINKVDRISQLLEKNLETVLNRIGNKYINDITEGRTRREGPAWQRAVDREFEPYQLENGGDLMSAVVHSLVVTKRTVGFSAGVLDSIAPYWRLFEYGGFSPAKPTAGRRVGASEGMHFFPQPGFGHSFQGYSAPGGSHPGVYPTRMFQDTFELNRKFAREEIQKAIRSAARGRTLK